MNKGNTAVKAGTISCLAAFLVIASFVRAATYEIPSGDVTALRAAITSANTNGEDDVINLAAGTYTLIDADNTDSTTGSTNGLPIVTADGGRSLTINGNGAVIMRSTTNGTPSFRLVRVGPGTNVIFNALTLSNGDSSGGRWGGAIFSDHGNVTLVDCSLSGNLDGGSLTAGGSFLAAGGGIYNAAGTLALLRCTFEGNQAQLTGPSPRAEGGAIYNDAGGSLNVQLCTFSGNSADAVCACGPFGGNGSSAAGGAIDSDGRAAITNSTFSGNFASEGTTISAFAGQNNVELGNSIVVGTGQMFYGGIVSRGYNMTNGNGDGLLVTNGDLVSFDPALRPLAFNGGLTKTHALPPYSTAVDKGKRDAIPALAATTDQRGVPRPSDYPGINAQSGGDSSDIGAYEIGVPQPGPIFTVTTVHDHDDGICESGDCTLREAINAANAQAVDNTITFAPGLSGTVQLTSALPNLSMNMTIDGPGANVVTVRRDTGGNYRIFTISNGTTPGPFVLLRGLTITNGQGTGSPANGGGIYNDHGALRIEGCAVTDNRATNAAGVWGVGGSIMIVDSTVSGNVTSGYGGGVFISAVGGTAVLNIANGTFANNSAARGAAIYNSGSSAAATVTLQNATLSGNSSSLASIFSDGAMAQVSLRNSVLSPASGSASFGNTNGATFRSLGHNISADAVGGDSGSGPGGVLNDSTDRRNTDPKFDGGLRDNGGATLTIALQSDSPAINSGDQNSAPTRDQRGFARAGTPDIGAFEFGGIPPTPTPTPTPIPTATPSPTATPAATPIPATLANISTRLRVGTGNNVLIGGFIVTGTQPKKVLLRAIGPSLSLAGKLANPVLELHDGSGSTIFTNDNWKDTQRDQIEATTAAPSNDLESAIVATLPANASNYTALIKGVNGGTGVGLVEIYDLDRTVDSKLANISTRGLVQTGDNVLIAGTIILGQAPQKVIIRAIGPSLGIAGKLTNPTLELRDQNGGLIRANDNWRIGGQEAEIIASTVPPTNDLESALVETLPSNGAAYTAIVRGVNNTTGIAVVEVYALD